MGVGGSVRTFVYRCFYRLPSRWRRRLVRAAMARYTVGAVALVRDAEATGAGRMLLLRQPGYLGWSLPAGLLRRGEQPIHGCVRELREETGIALSPDDLTAATPNAVVHSHGHWVDVVFEASVPASAYVLQPDPAEVLEAAWHRIDNLPPLTGPTAKLLSYYGIGPYVDYPE